jgi:hypothetical protein
MFAGMVFLDEGPRTETPWEADQTTAAVGRSHTEPGKEGESTPTAEDTPDSTIPDRSIDLPHGIHDPDPFHVQAYLPYPP